MGNLSRKEAYAELQAAGRYLLANELAWGNAGNLSARLAADRGVITASGTRLGELAEHDFAEFSIGDGLAGNRLAGNRLAGDGLAGDGPALPQGRKPSKEVPMHRAVYEVRPEINAVLHAAPCYSTLVACSGLALPADLFVEDMYYLERVARVRYEHPGSAALGEAVREQAARANILLLENHGVLVCDTSVREALMGLHTLEMVCRLVITARSAGIALAPLAARTVEDFLARSGYRPRREWPP